MQRYSITGIIYLIIGVIVASNRGYLGDLNTLSNLFSGVLAIILWPLLFFGANLHVVL
jgi:hypothetical protein